MEHVLYVNQSVHPEDIFDMALKVALAEDAGSEVVEVVSSLLRAWSSLKTARAEEDGETFKARLLAWGEAEHVFFETYTKISPDYQERDAWLPEVVNAQGGPYPRRFIVTLAKALAKSEQARIKAWKAWEESEEGKAQIASWQKGEATR